MTTHICCKAMQHWIDGNSDQVAPVCISADYWRELTVKERKHLYPGATSAGWHELFRTHRSFGRTYYRYVKLDCCPFCDQSL